MRIPKMGHASAVAAPRTVPVFQRALCRRPAQIRQKTGRPSFARVRQSLIVSVIAATNAVRISASPCYYGWVVRLTVNRVADEERRALLRCAGRTFDCVPRELKSNSLA